MRTRLCCLLTLATLTFCPDLPAEDRPNAKEEEALLKNAEAFVEAFQKGDAKALAGFWTADGDYTDQTGRNLKGRDAIEKAFKGLFAENKGLKLRINIDALKFLTAEVAVEDGVTEVIPPDGLPPSRARYTIVHVKKDGKWLLGSVRESTFSPPSNYEHLRGLEWAVGEWADDAEKGEVARASFSWSAGQNFLVASFDTSIKNVSLAGGTQWIGWDPSAKQVRSWAFGNDGSFAEGTWTRDRDRWTIKTKAILRDGKKLTATNIVARADANTLTWESKDRTLDGKALPDVKAVKMKRVK